MGGAGALADQAGPGGVETERCEATRPSQGCSHSPAGRIGSPPHFHFGHIQRGFAWTTTDRSLDEYVALWADRIDTVASVPKAEWDEYWAWLEREGVAGPQDRPDFDAAFTDTQRHRPHRRGPVVAGTSVVSRRCRNAR